MRREHALVLDERDEEVANLLVALGLARSVARTLVYLSQVESAVSTEIEHGAALRQPEVSVAMRQLRARGWIAKQDLKRAGKGRPVHSYRLARPLDHIIATIEAEKRAAAERDLTTIQRLRVLAGAK